MITIQKHVAEGFGEKYLAEHYPHVDFDIADCFAVWLDGNMLGTMMIEKFFDPFKSLHIHVYFGQEHAELKSEHIPEMRKYLENVILPEYRKQGFDKLMASCYDLENKKTIDFMKAFKFDMFIACCKQF